MTNQELKEEDLKYIFHPCTQMKDHEKLPLISIKKAYGVYLEDFEGNRYIDAISSWWVNTLGHSNKFINEKIKAQLDNLEHILLAGFTHEPAVKLAKKLVELTPNGLDKVFFADNGSSGIEVALKMAFHYHANKGEKREYFVSLENSYHGETIGALSVSDMGLYKDVYNPILIKTLRAKSPKSQTKEEAKIALLDMENLLKEKHKNIVAIIVEPLIQCAGNMNMYHSDYLVGLRELCDLYDVFLIADEVAVGFGRTGKLFACEWAEITPDFMILSKGLTAGYLPLSVVMMKQKIYDAFYCEYDTKGVKSFLHSHSYTGNPLSCTAALAGIEFLENENVIENNKKTIRFIQEQLKRLESFPTVTNIRQQGMVCAFDIVGYKSEDRIGIKFYEYALKMGVILRPLGNVIYFMPPYIITQEEIEKVFDTIVKSLKNL
ncbi:MAG: adenosylmethionine--8-amino-7-oxononanoate transaminase [Arcobacteraceae bacterium]|nr:adenosylmethionine--8-amino-7-oxononanoate transaminase [Arcobacteraceae bacterium]